MISALDNQLALSTKVIGSLAEKKKAPVFAEISGWTSGRSSKTQANLEIFIKKNTESNDVANPLLADNYVLKLRVCSISDGGKRQGWHKNRTLSS